MQVVRFEPEVVIPLALQVAALLIFAAGLDSSFWVVLCTPYFSTLVPHPGYAGSLFAHLVLPIALNSVWTLLPSIGIRILPPLQIGSGC